MSAGPTAREESAVSSGLGEPEERVGDERRQAVRLLLASPFLADDSADPETFALVRRHDRWLKIWFGEQMGYRLVVDTELARLHKRPAPGARRRALLTRSGAPFSPRHYALGCLVLAALERMEIQTTLSDLAAQVKVLAGSEEGVRDFDLDRYAERLAFVEAVRWLVDLSVLRLADGDESSFVEGRGDALYDVHGRRLTQLLAAPVPPALAAGPEELAAETYPATEEGANRRLRHRLMRRLVEEPVLYFADLEPAELAYLTSQRHYLSRQVAEATGMVVEVRKEGLAAIDPEERLSDLAFPSSGTVSHAALLLGEELAARARRDGGLEAIPRRDLASLLEDLLVRYGRFWSQRYKEDPDRLLDEALLRLELMGLADLRPEGVVARPAVARLRPAAVGTGDAERDRDTDV
jgi:uncharacterized protein (TIGR02678 family)